MVLGARKLCVRCLTPTVSFRSALPDDLSLCSESLLYSANVHTSDTERVMRIMADSMLRPEYTQEEIDEIRASLKTPGAFCSERADVVLMDAVHKVRNHTVLRPARSSDLGLG